MLRFEEFEHRVPKVSVPRPAGDSAVCVSHHRHTVFLKLAATLQLEVTSDFWESELGPHRWQSNILHAIDSFKSLLFYGLTEISLLVVRTLRSSRAAPCWSLSTAIPWSEQGHLDAYHLEKQDLAPAHRKLSVPSACCLVFAVRQSDSGMAVPQVVLFQWRSGVAMLTVARTLLLWLFEDSC
jgi:hypothetical protein